MKEENVPQVNPVRRQLLIGAGLAPVFLTLGAAKVNGQELNVGSPSGAAPFSGAIQGSVSLDGTGNEGTEIELYNALFDGDKGGEYQNYYGYLGSGTTEWTYGAAGSVNGLAWTSSFEKRYAETGNMLRGYIADLESATAKYSAATPTNNSEKPEVNVTPEEQASITAAGDYVANVKEDFEEKLAVENVDTTKGVWKFASDAITAFNTAWTAYSNAKSAYDAYEPTP